MFLSLNLLLEAVDRNFIMREPYLPKIHKLMQENFLCPRSNYRTTGIPNKIVLCVRN